MRYINWHFTYLLTYLPSSTVCCRMDHFSQRSWPEATPTEVLTEAINYATLSSSKQLLNVIFIWFTGKNLFILATMKNSHNSDLYSSVATKKKHIGAKRYLCTWTTFGHSVTVLVGVSKFDYTGLILLDLESQNQLNLLLWLVSAITVVACRMSGLWKVQKQCPLYRSR